MKAETDMPDIVECHCLADAERYYSRTYVNKMGHTVHKVFYRCVNCLSRVYRDYIPELDKMETINMADMEQVRKLAERLSNKKPA